MFVTPAYAQAAGAAASGGVNEMLINFVPFGFVLLIFYFLLLRPQQRRMKENQAMLASVKKGDTIVTTGGLVGKVTRDNDETELEIEVAAGIKVRVTRQSVAEIRGKTPAA